MELPLPGGGKLITREGSIVSMKVSSNGDLNLKLGDWHGEIFIPNKQHGSRKKTDSDINDESNDDEDLTVEEQMAVATAKPKAAGGMATGVRGFAKPTTTAAAGKKTIVKTEPVAAPGGKKQAPPAAAAGAPALKNAPTKKKSSTAVTPLDRTTVKKEPATSKNKAAETSNQSIVHLEDDDSDSSSAFESSRGENLVEYRARLKAERLAAEKLAAEKHVAEKKAAAAPEKKKKAQETVEIHGTVEEGMMKKKEEMTTNAAAAATTESGQHTGVKKSNKNDEKKGRHRVNKNKALEDEAEPGDRKRPATRGNL